MISKIAAILLAVSDGGGTLTEIAARSDLPLSTVHRLATELAAWQVLARDADGRYGAGPSLRTAGACSFGGPSCTGYVRDRAVPVMEDLFRATGAQVRVGVLDGVAVSYVEKTSAHRPVSWLSPAARLPAHATALGKALLAFAPSSTIDAVVSLGLRQYTPHTVTHPERLRWALRTVRATRIAICDRELDRAARAVAAPVFGAGGRAVAAVEIAVRDLAKDVPAIRAPLAVAAGWLSSELASPVGGPRDARPERHPAPVLPASERGSA
ncbi:MAG TPA: IclR family transcriptional regulator C-terminal domain-containing protein [Pseudonocardia sp.]|nr:IclR family transcriptional regulator C-terminal domain-containing protein [Pseudonocardia sp.]